MLHLRQVRDFFQCCSLPLHYFHLDKENTKIKTDDDLNKAYKLIKAASIVDLNPWYLGFKGIIEKADVLQALVIPISQTCPFLAAFIRANCVTWIEASSSPLVDFVNKISDELPGIISVVIGRMQSQGCQNLFDPVQCYAKTAPEVEQQKQPNIILFPIISPLRLT